MNLAPFYGFQGAALQVRREQARADPTTMGGWHIYCAICGGPFLTPDNPEGLDDFDFHFENPAARSDRPIGAPRVDPVLPAEAREFDLPLEHVRWLSHMHVVGRNLATGRCYFTGRAWDVWDGIVGVDPAVCEGDVPTPRHLEAWPNENTEFDGEGGLNLAAYDDQGELPQFPVHLECVRVVERAYQRRSGLAAGEELAADSAKHWLEVLVSGCQVAQGGSAPCMGSLCEMDYQEFADYAGNQYWFGAGQDEPWLRPWLCDPEYIPALASVQPPPPLYPTGEANAQPNEDIFARLPTELIWAVADLLFGEDVSRWVAVSRSARSACDGTYWCQRVDRDMPYLYDLKVVDDSGKSVDWHATYKMLRDHAFPPLPVFDSYEDWEKRHLPQALEDKRKRDDDPGLTALASRRRVWRCCEQLLDHERGIGASSS